MRQAGLVAPALRDPIHSQGSRMLSRPVSKLDVATEPQVRASPQSTSSAGGVNSHLEPQTLKSRLDLSTFLDTASCIQLPLSSAASTHFPVFQNLKAEKPHFSDPLAVGLPKGVVASNARSWDDTGGRVAMQSLGTRCHSDGCQGRVGCGWQERDNKAPSSWPHSHGYPSLSDSRGHLSVHTHQPI